MTMEKLLMVIAYLSLMLAFSSARKADTFDVTKYGAQPNMDISEALSNAWKDACALPRPSRVFIPNGVFKLRKVSLQGPCKSQIRIELRGTLVGPTDSNGFKSGDGWFTIGRVNRFTLAGGGTFDGQGPSVWGKHCDQSQYCGQLPINIRLDFVTNSLIRNIVSLNSKQFHINVLGGENITFSGISIIAPENSPNTDGIHIGRSVGINIFDTTIQTGDDCISLGDGSREINITKVTCGPGHGISVGSLGKYENEEPVEGVTVRNCTIKGTTNGVRIKTWPDSHDGTASNMHFEDIIMDSVSYPIIIDQEYCPWDRCNKQVPSKIKISDVSFKKIRGSSASALAVNLVCSNGNPCQNVEIGDIDLKYNGPEGSITSHCKNIQPKITGKQNPSACMTS